MREKDIAPLLGDPEAIRLYLGLRNRPIYITDVYVQKDISIVVGRIGPQPNFGLNERSGFQYQLITKIDDSCFINTRLITTPTLSPRKARKLSTTIEY